jgi:TonB family protein
VVAFSNSTSTDKNQMICIDLRIAALTLSLMLSAVSHAAIQSAATPQPNADASPKPAKLTSLPNPDASGIYHVGDGVTPPKLIYHGNPEFSKMARKRKISANVLIKVIVDTNGTVREANITRSAAERYTTIKDREAALSLDQNALKVVKQYRFEPASFQGQLVPIELNIEVNYKIYPS